MATRTLLVRQDKHEVITLHDLLGSAMPEKMPASSKRPLQLPEYVSRFSRSAARFFKVSFSGRKKYGN
jgi:hypothetical protein